MADEVQGPPNTKHGFRYFSELVLFLYSFGYMLQYPTAHQYVYSRFSKERGFDYHYEETVTSRQCQNGVLNATQIQTQQQVQSLTANFAIYYHAMSIIPSVVMNLFYGALSDHVGRRCVMTVVFVGAICESTLLLANMYLELPLWTIFIGNICSGLGGGLNGIFMLIIAYTADVTDKESRTMRIGFIEASLFLGMTLSNFISGHLIEKYGFTVPQIVVVISQLAAIFYIAFVLKQSRDENKPTNHMNRERSMCSVFYKQPLIMWRTLVKEREDRDLMFLAIIVLVSGLTFIVSVLSVFTLYLLNRPFCWPAIDVGYIMGTYFLLLAVGTAFGMRVLRMVIPEWALSLIGYAFSSVSFVYIAFARNKGSLYGAIALRLFGGLPTAIFRGNISKCVKENEQGAIFSVITSIEMLMLMVGIAIFNSAYARLNNIGHPGWFFLIPGIAIVLPFVLAMVYWKAVYARRKHHDSLPMKDLKEQEHLLNHQIYEDDNDDVISDSENNNL